MVLDLEYIRVVSGIRYWIKSNIMMSLSINIRSRESRRY